MKIELTNLEVYALTKATSLDCEDVDCTDCPLLDVCEDHEREKVSKLLLQLAGVI